MDTSHCIGSMTSGALTVWPCAVVAVIPGPCRLQLSEWFSLASNGDLFCFCSELSKPLLPVGRAAILFSEILHLLCKQMVSLIFVDMVTFRALRSSLSSCHLRFSAAAWCFSCIDTSMTGIICSKVALYIVFCLWVCVFTCVWLCYRAIGKLEIYGESLGWTGPTSCRRENIFLPSSHNRWECSLNTRPKCKFPQTRHSNIYKRSFFLSQ